MERDWSKVRAAGKYTTFQAAAVCMNSIMSTIVDEVAAEKPIRITIDYDPEEDGRYIMSVAELPRQDTREGSETHEDPQRPQQGTQ